MISSLCSGQMANILSRHCNNNSLSRNIYMHAKLKTNNEIFIVFSASFAIILHFQKFSHLRPGG